MRTKIFAFVLVMVCIFSASTAFAGRTDLVSHKGSSYTFKFYHVKTAYRSVCGEVTVKCDMDISNEILLDIHQDMVSFLNNTRLPLDWKRSRIINKKMFKLLINAGTRNFKVSNNL